MTDQPPPEGNIPPPPGDWKTRFKELARSSWEKSSKAWNEAEWPGKLKETLSKRVVEPLRESSSEWRLREKFSKLLPSDLAKTLPRTFEPLAMAEWFGTAVQRQGAGFYGTLATVVLSTYFLADLSALTLEKYIPEAPPSRVVRIGQTGRRTRTIDDYNAIFARNLFSSQGVIPGESQPEVPTNTPQDLGGPPIKTTLPFNLIGTMILHDELRSIATIEDKSVSIVYPVRQTDEIPTKAKILTIEPRRVVFLNTSSGRREYVELPEEGNPLNQKITVGRPAAKGGGGPGIERTSPTQFNVSRTEVDKALTDLNQVLTQARAVPNFENGLPSGYKLFQIVPGSIYDKLGLQNGDTIAGLNGATINDPGKAFEMLGELKTASHLELNVKRDGKSQNFTYDIH